MEEKRRDVKAEVGYRDIKTPVEVRIGKKCSNCEGPIEIRTPSNFPHAYCIACEKMLSERARHSGDAECRDGELWGGGIFDDE